jgi:hypothetical protein
MKFFHSKLSIALCVVEILEMVNEPKDNGVKILKIELNREELKEAIQDFKEIY